MMRAAPFDFFFQSTALSTFFILCSLATNEIPTISGAPAGKIVQPPKPNILKQVRILSFLFLSLEDSLASIYPLFPVGSS